MKIKYAGILSFLFSFFLQGNPAEDIMQARALQRSASYAEYYDLEQKIMQIKSEHHNMQIFERSWIQRSICDLYHGIPMVIWQLFFLSIFFIIMVKFARGIHVPFSIVMIFIVIGIINGVGYAERSSKWLVLQKDNVGVRLGPDIQYPMIAQLHFLDEVQVIKKNGNYLEIDHNGLIGWIAYDCNE